MDKLSCRTDILIAIASLFVSDIDECQENPCINGKCMNMAASFRCICMTGYTLDESGIRCVGKQIFGYIPVSNSRKFALLLLKLIWLIEQIIKKGVSVSEESVI